MKATHKIKFLVIGAAFLIVGSAKLFSTGCGVEAHCMGYVTGCDPDCFYEVITDLQDNRVKGVCNTGTMDQTCEDTGSDLSLEVHHVDLSNTCPNCDPPSWDPNSECTGTFSGGTVTTFTGKLKVTGSCVGE